MKLSELSALNKVRLCYFALVAFIFWRKVDLYSNFQYHTIDGRLFYQSTAYVYEMSFKKVQDWLVFGGIAFFLVPFVWRYAEQVKVFFQKVKGLITAFIGKCTPALIKKTIDKYGFKRLLLCVYYGAIVLSLLHNAYVKYLKFYPTQTLGEVFQWEEMTFAVLGLFIFFFLPSFFSRLFEKLTRQPQTVRKKEIIFAEIKARFEADLE